MSPPLRVGNLRDPTLTVDVAARDLFGLKIAGNSGVHEDLRELAVRPPGHGMSNPRDKYHSQNLRHREYFALLRVLRVVRERHLRRLLR